MEAAEDAGLHQVPGYPNIEHAQYDNSQYGFAQDSNPFPIDQNLEMSVNFVSSDGKNQNDAIGNNHMSLSGQNGHAGAMRSHQGSTNTSGSLTTTTQPQTPLNASTKRKSPEDITESTPAGGDSRRKRSKVSRACDQCRRKKVRCDADSGDGNLKTCTNCIKQGQTCDYNRIPQKRGPSKGYIKDLSERVHHLEDSLANAGNYRSSLDAGTYADAPFSPDDDLSQRRQTSISQQRSPFADFTRERFPSIGGWNNTSQASIPPRDRGSIAIPPDQLGPSQPTSAKSSRPRWGPQLLPPPEKIKPPAEIHEITKLVEAIKTDHYYKIIHPQCPILPDRAKVLEILVKASHEHALALGGAMNLLPKKKDGSSRSGKTKEELEDFVKVKGQLKYVDKSNIDNLVLLWTTLLLHIHYFHNVWEYEKSGPLIHIELDLVDGFVKTLEFALDPYEYDWIRSFNIAALFARLNAVARGNSADPLPSYLASYLNADCEVIGQRTRMTVMMTDALQVGLATVPRDGVGLDLKTLESIGRLQSSTMRAWLSATGVSPDEPFVKELQAFMALLSLRFITPGAGPDILGPVCQLVETVRANSLQQDEDEYVFNPLSFHTVTLATTTLVELHSCDLDQQYGQAMVDRAINNMVEELVLLAKRADQLEVGADGLFWAKALTDLVEENISQSFENNQEDKAVQELAWIIHHGYLQPLLDSVSNRLSSQ